MRRGMRKDYLHMAKQADNFLKMLRTAPHDDIAFALYMTALRLKAAISATKFEELSEHAQAKSGEPSLLEIIRLMELLKDSTKEQAEYFRERPGPKINLGLEYLVRRVADLFGERDRKFSIDHHKPGSNRSRRGICPGTGRPTGRRCRHRNCDCNSCRTKSQAQSR